MVVPPRSVVEPWRLSSSSNTFGVSLPAASFLTSPWTAAADPAAALSDGACTAAGHVFSRFDLFSGGEDDSSRLSLDEGMWSAAEAAVVASDAFW